MSRQATIYKTLCFEHRDVAHHFYDYTGDQPENDYIEQLRAESHAPGFILITDEEGETIKSIPL